MFTRIKTATAIGINVLSVDVEVNLKPAIIPKFTIVGLPNKSIEESKARIKAVIDNTLPKKFSLDNFKVTVNLAPADIPKYGSAYDLPIALGIIAQQLNFEIPENALFFGELSMNGELRTTKAIFLMTIFAKEQKYKTIFIPKANSQEVSYFNSMQIYPASHIQEVIAHLEKREFIPVLKYQKDSTETKISPTIDFADIIGQQSAKRALTIAVAGKHNILLSGPPGGGKTLMSKATQWLQPRLSEKESIEVTKIYSAAGQIRTKAGLITEAPFRSPHHTTSTVGIIGGGSVPQPGEITLAHNGILFLDEFAEFPQALLESLRQPLEDGVITISRSKAKVTYPAKFMLIASTNPCPCGFLGSIDKQCTCSPRSIQRYKNKLSGPIIDRIDLQITVQPLPKELLQQFKNQKSKSTQEIKHQIITARHKQATRFSTVGISYNTELTNKLIKQMIKIDPQALRLLNKYAQKFHISTRAFFKVIKIGQTIADLDDKEQIDTSVIQEAIMYKTEE